MPLKLSLKPGEAVVVNGAVIRNGERRGTLLLETKARILRERDVMFPEQVKSSADAAYLAVMQMYLTGEEQGPIYDTCIAALADLMAETESEQARETVLGIARAVASGQAYRALGTFRKLARGARAGDAHAG